jgi:hypothetical protein
MSVVFATDFRANCVKLSKTAVRKQHMTLSHTILAATMLLGTATIASANLTVQFVESAPKDSFILSNTGTCTLAAQTVSFDLATSRAGLIFDVTGAGAGVEVFQPLDVVDQNPLVLAISEISDGDQTLDIGLDEMTPGAKIRVTFDMDDTLTNSSLGQIRVSRSEIEGASAMTNLAIDTPSAQFDAEGVVVIPQPACVS